jgi:hypothetical protein
MDVLGYAEGQNFFMIVSRNQPACGSAARSRR